MKDFNQSTFVLGHVVHVFIKQIDCITCMYIHFLFNQINVINWQI